MSTYDPLTVAGPTGWLAPVTWDQAAGAAAVGASTALPQNTFYVPTHAGVIQDISGYPTELNATTKCFVSAEVGELLVDVSANYNVTLTDNQTLTQVSLAYDNILDYTLGQADSIAFLNAFSVAGIKLQLPNGLNDQQAAGATCGFGVEPVRNLMETVLNSATDPSGNKAHEFLAETLNAVLAQVNESTFTSTYATLANGDGTGGPNINLADIALGVDVSSSVVTIDANTSATNIGSVCYGTVGAQALINQIDVNHINAYKSDTTDTITTTAFPGLVGDQFVFGLRNNAPQVEFTYNKATSSAPNDLGALNYDWRVFRTDSVSACPVKDNNWTLAFRLTLTKNASSAAGVQAVTGTGAYGVGAGGLDPV